jgi:cysteine synthase A
MITATPSRLQGIRPLIGNTPLLAIHFEFGGKNRTIYAKAENFNLTGSIKDRMALYVLERAMDRGTISPGYRIAEATSGNTGISFAAIGRALGHQVEIFIPDWLSQERIALIRSFGAHVHMVSKKEGGFLGAIDRAETFAEEHKNVFLPRQFANEDNTLAHAASTGPEIAAQLIFRGLEPDAFVAGVGTGGTVMGVGRNLKQRWPDLKVHPLEPASSPTLTTGFQTGTHRIQGISDEFIPSIVNLRELDEVVAASDGDAILMAQKLAGELGLGLGISSGANFLGALQIQNELGDDATVVTVFPDSNKKYLSTDLLKNEPVKAGYLSPSVRLNSLEAIGRVCGMCDDPVSQLNE